MLIPFPLSLVSLPCLSPLSLSLGCLSPLVVSLVLSLTTGVAANTGAVFGRRRQGPTAQWKKHEQPRLFFVLVLYHRPCQNTNHHDHHEEQEEQKEQSRVPKIRSPVHQHDEPKIKLCDAADQMGVEVEKEGTA
jgi:hypothetical protein